MIKEKIEKFKNIFIKKTEGNNKKNIENLVVFVILLIITIIAINSIWGKNDKDTNNQSQKNTNSYKELAEDKKMENITSTIGETNEYNLEEDLENILSKISGVGDVKVLITYYETSEIVPMYNEAYSSTLTEETDTEGRN